MARQRRVTESNINGENLGVWAAVAIVQSGHDMWTLRVVTVDTYTDEEMVEHVLIGPSEKDAFEKMGVPTYREGEGTWTKKK